MTRKIWQQQKIETPLEHEKILAPGSQKKLYDEISTLLLKKTPYLKIAQKN